MTPFALGQYTTSVHGSNSSDTVISIDGMRVNNLCGSGQYSGFYMNDAAIEEVSFTTGAESAEMQERRAAHQQHPARRRQHLLRIVFRLRNYSGVGRITWQATARDKFRLYIEKQFNGEFFNGYNTYPTTTPEASTDAFGRGWVTQIKWSQTTTNKLLLEAGITYYNQPYEQNSRPTVGPRDLPMRELATGLLTGSNGHVIPSYTSWTKSYSSMASASYITGSHAFQTGMTMNWTEAEHRRPLRLLQRRGAGAIGARRRVDCGA